MFQDKILNTMKTSNTKTEIITKYWCTGVHLFIPSFTCQCKHLDIAFNWEELGSYVQNVQFRTIIIYIMILCQKEVCHSSSVTHCFKYNLLSHTLIYNSALLFFWRGGGDLCPCIRWEIHFFIIFYHSLRVVFSAFLYGTSSFALSLSPVGYGNKSFNTVHNLIVSQTKTSVIWGYLSIIFGTLSCSTTEGSSLTSKIWKAKINEQQLKMDSTHCT